MRIKKVTKNTVVHQVMDQIKTLVSTGELKPGDKLPTETMLMEQFGTGRSTIREALKIFEFLGVIEAHTRTGTFVCDYSNISTEALTWSILLGKQELFELVDLRSIIEQRALQLIIARSRSDRQFHTNLLGSLDTVVDDMEKAVAQAGIEDLIAADYQFHGIIINAGGKAVYINIYQTLKAFMHEEIKRTNVRTTDQAKMVEEHRQIIRGIRNTDLEAALTAFNDHITNTVEQLG